MLGDVRLALRDDARAGLAGSCFRHNLPNGFIQIAATPKGPFLMNDRLRSTARLAGSRHTSSACGSKRRKGHAAEPPARTRVMLIGGDEHADRGVQRAFGAHCEVAQADSLKVAVAGLRRGCDVVLLEGDKVGWSGTISRSEGPAQIASALSMTIDPAAARAIGQVLRAMVGHRRSSANE